MGFCVGGWCDVGNGYDVIIGRGNVAGRVTIRISNTINSSDWTGTNDGQWHHVVGVIDRGTDLIKIYGDGVQHPWRRHP